MQASKWRQLWKVLWTVQLFAIFASAGVYAQTTEIVGNVRVQLLSPTLVRLELKGPGGYEDRKTFNIVEHSWPGASITRGTSGSDVVIYAADYTIKVPSNATSLNGIVITKPDGTTLWSMPSASGTVYSTIKCRWQENSEAYLYDNGDKASYGDNPSNDYYLWSFETAGGYTQIRNKATGDYLNIETLKGYVECTPVQSYWNSKDWTLETVDGNVRFKCRWGEHPDYIHAENQTGYAEHGAVQSSWLSAQWEKTSTDFLSNNRYWLPSPKDSPQAWAIVDTPRYVPASWGYNPAPAGVPNYSTNGWDLSNNAPDVYVFLPKGDVKKLRNDYISLTGRTELIPLQALGSWYSRYYPYTQAQSIGIMDTYRSKNIPLDVYVADTDWRVGASSGYAVNTTLFPDMQNFLSDAHNRNINVIFNDHPEPKATALDPVEVTFRNNGLKSLFNIGLDWWWFDRNWNVSMASPVGINKEVFGMYVYDWITKNHYTSRRPFILANVDGIDNGSIRRPPEIAAHRYTYQWTGDTWSDYKSLAREVQNAVYSGVYAAYAYTSSDIGGHNGTLTPQAYARWVEYGALSPIFRLHSYTAYTRDPWAPEYAPLGETVVRNFVQMRMRLLPVFYSAARNNYDSGEPILRRADFDYPAYAEASSNSQYLLGKGILVAPIVTDGTTRSVWVPPGTWTDVWTGTRLTGPKTITATAAADKIPLYVKAGTIIPLAPDMQYTKQRAWDSITLDAYPDVAGGSTASIYEDDKESTAYKTGTYWTTQVSLATDSTNKVVNIAIDPAVGSYAATPSTRSWTIHLRKPYGWSPVESVTVNGLSTPYTIVPKNPNAMVFVNSGGSPDADVIEIAINNQSIYSAKKIAVQFSKIPNTLFMVVNKSSGKALDLISGDTANGARVNQWSYDYNGPNQRWQLVPVDGEHYKLQSFVSEKVACVAGDSVSDGAQIHDWDFRADNPSHKWDLVDAGNGWFKIKNLRSGKMLEVAGSSTADDAKVQQMADNGGQANQLWRLQPWGDYYIKASTGKYIAVQGAGTSNGSRIMQYQFEANAWFKWRFETAGEGLYKVSSLNALTRSIDVHDVSTAAGAYCHLWDYQGGSNQKIRIAPQTDGKFKFYFQHTGFSWDIPGGNSANDVELDQYPNNANAWQEFSLECVE